MHRRGSAKLIRRHGLAYLERFYVLALGPLRVFVHCFYMDDPDPLHDHPWAWGRVILSGRYREHHHDGTWTDCSPGHVVWYKAARELHRVQLLTPEVVTLFWHWRRWRTWGFTLPSGWTPTPDEGQDGRGLRGWLLPRKVGRVPSEFTLKKEG